MPAKIAGRFVGFLLCYVVGQFPSGAKAEVTIGTGVTVVKAVTDLINALNDSSHKDVATKQDIERLEGKLDVMGKQLTSIELKVDGMAAALDALRGLVEENFDQLYKNPLTTQVKLINANYKTWAGPQYSSSSHPGGLTPTTALEDLRKATVNLTNRNNYYEYVAIGMIYEKVMFTLLKTTREDQRGSFLIYAEYFHKAASDLPSENNVFLAHADAQKQIDGIVRSIDERRPLYCARAVVDDKDHLCVRDGEGGYLYQDVVVFDGNLDKGFSIVGKKEVAWAGPFGAWTTRPSTPSDPSYPNPIQVPIANRCGPVSNYLPKLGPNQDSCEAFFAEKGKAYQHAKKLEADLHNVLVEIGKLEQLASSWANTQ